MRRLVAFLIAFAFVSVSLTSPSVAMPTGGPAHETHCADMAPTMAGHDKAPAKENPGQKCCFAALPVANLFDPSLTQSLIQPSDVPTAPMSDKSLSGMNWTADPPPPRLG